ncbi:PorP/SprF family type IX secretion system membrane protein [Fibrella forsythiae]|uniref:Type IX secretion system membrane protein PorP/SprF n=1 Tax=Fibrella forsythiae TaxID=2817061 RepID=A0ABS3JDM5_9BACT|nr:type IX secretion system membrane protein PorP/SprF [Fibrella forsythiae]MBO0948105.1 type IX secretion system membrane protein PorP/SprF [Fibrella forsythiae]
MLRKLYVSLGGWLLALTAFGQQDPQFSLFPFAPTFYNPAAAGSEGLTRIQLIYRTQWAGYQTSGGAGGAPTTQLLTANLPLTRLNSGVGIYAFNDAIGPQANQSVQVAYAYRLPLKSGTLAFGVQGGVYNKSIDYSDVIVRDPGDPLIGTGKVSQMQPDVSAGIHYNTVDYWVGVSLFHLATTSYKLGTAQGINPLSRTAYLSAGYRLGVSYAVDVQPSVLYKYSTEPGPQASSLDLNLLATVNNYFFFGAGYRTGEAITGMAGINLLANNALRLGLSGDLTTVGTSAKRPASYEFMLSYALPAPNTSKKPIIRTPRFRY